MKITTQRIGGIWHGYLEGHPEVDERGLTEEAARAKVGRIVERMHAEDAARDGAPDTDSAPTASERMSGSQMGTPSPGMQGRSALHARRRRHR
jgi:hypothetical protein